MKWGKYTAKEHIEILKQHNIAISMDTKGKNRKEKANCFAFLGLKQKALCFSIAEGIDNIVIFQTSLRNFASLHERFLRMFKYENVYPSSYKNIKEAKNGIDKYVKTYNKKEITFKHWILNTQ